MALMSYLIRDGLGTYYFRRVIPAELRPFMPEPWTGKANWKLSLRTKDPAAAKKAGSRLLRDCMTDFEQAERTKRGEIPAAPARRAAAMPRPEEIEADVLAGLLAADDAERSDGDARRQLQTAAERSQWPDLVPVAFGRRGMAEDHHHVYGGELEELAADYRKALSRSDPRIVDAATRDFLRRNQAPIDPTSEAYHEASLAVLRAHVKAYGLLLARQEGEAVATPPPRSHRGPTITEAYEAWKKGGASRGSRKPSDRTLLEAERSVRLFTEWHGDIRLGDLTREAAREFSVALGSVPTRLPAELRKLPLRDLLKQDLKGYVTQHAATINKTLTILSAIVSHAEAAGSLDSVPGFKNPFVKGIKHRVDEKAEEKRQAFNAADLKAIFSTGVYVSGHRPKGGGGEAAYWLPLLALLSGARQGELAQLRVMDVTQDAETGVWYLDIGTAGGRSIKTASSRRKIPLHPELERIGLLRYRASLLDTGSKPDSPLWPHVEADNEGRPNGPWSKWFNRYLRDKAGIEDRTKVFHSFRHTFKELARAAKLAEDVHDALTGHTGGGVGRQYGGFGLKVLSEELARIEAPDLVRGLRWHP